MTEWAAKVLEGVPRIIPPQAWVSGQDFRYAIMEADAIAAIAKLGEGGGLVERATAALEGVTDGPWSVPGQPDKICAEGYTRNGMAKTIATVSTPAWMGDAEPWANTRFIAFTRQWVPEAAAHIAALTAKIEELRGVRRDDALELLAAHRQAQEAYAAQLAAEAEADALRAKVARLEGALDDQREGGE